MANIKEDLRHYLRTGEVSYDPHNNPDFIRLLRRFLVGTFALLERAYPAQRQQLLAGTDLPNFSAQDIVRITYEAVLETFPECREHEKRDEVIGYALRSFDLMSLEQLLEDMPPREPPKTQISVEYDIFGDVVKKAESISFGEHYPLVWREYLFWVVKHINSLSTLDEEQQRLLADLSIEYSAKYDEDVPDREKPFRIYAFRAPLNGIEANPKKALGREVSDFGHEVVHFFQHYLVPDDYSEIDHMGHSDIISSGLSSLVAYTNGLHPGDEVLLELEGDPANRHYYVGAVMALRCKDDLEPFKSFRERLDRYISSGHTPSIIAPDGTNKGK